MTTLEFSRPVNTARLAGGMDQSIVARPGECKAIAQRLLIPTVAELQAIYDVRPASHGRLIEVEGRLTARVTQTCVVTGEAFESAVVHNVKALFGDAPTDAEPDAGSEWDDVEPIENGEIDLGELTVQHLALALDPYPRKPGAALPEVEAGPEKRNPFAVLDGLKK